VTEPFRFALIGLGAGSLYALAAIGLVLVYRGSGVVNFAQGAMGMVGAYAYYEARVQHDLSEPISIAIGLLTSAAIGAAFYLLILRRMREASNLAKIVATLALLVVLQSAAVLAYGPLPRLVPSLLPTQPVTVLGAVIGEDRIWIFGIVLVLTSALWLVYRFTTFGIATTAVSENPTGAAALGVSPDLVAALNWAFGAALGALAAILLVPITGLAAGSLTFLVIPIVAAAVIGRFSSFPITTLAGLAIGIAQSEVTRYGTGPGWATAVPFVLVTVVLIARGRRIARKDEHFGRQPRLGSGRWAPGLLIGTVCVALLCTWVIFPSNWVEALQVQILVAILLMSYVVVTGYAGQLSLAQVAFAGLGALMGGWLISSHGWPLELAILAGMIVTIPIGLVLGLAGVRTRGVNLAIVTLGFSIALEAVVFANPEYTGGISGFRVDDATIFGIHIDGLRFPERYTTFALLVLVTVGIAVANLRRGRAGRRLIAVRTNERAAAALGISVVGVKLYAFVLGGMIAALGGSLLAFRRPTLSFQGFAGLQSVVLMQSAVLGGVGTLAGPPLGAGVLPGTLGQTIFSFVGSDIAVYLSLAAGVGLLLMLTRAPDGLAFLVLAQARRPVAAIRRRVRSKPPVPDAGASPAAPVIDPVTPRRLVVEGLTVRFGGVTAVDRLTLEVGPGEVVGLIGPNGAGKSTTIDAITGVVQPTEGTITLDGVVINRWSPERRARAGIGRSFQTLELFDDLTVLENILAACDTRDHRAYLTDLVAPGRAHLTEVARTVVVEFDLARDLETPAKELHYGQRRRLAIARAAAGAPSILLLDEPAAGLDEHQSRHLGGLVRRLADDWGMGVLVIEHNVDMVLRTCDRIYALDFGALLASGTPAQIRSDPAVVESYLGTFHADAIGHRISVASAEPT